MNWLDANALPWLIPLPPLIAFVLIILVAGRYRTLTHVIAIGAIFISWLFSLSEVIAASRVGNLGTAAGGVFGSSIPWLANGSGGAGSGALTMGVLVDPLTQIMLFMVPLVCLLIFIYSVGYMADDSRNTRFFAYLSLFASAMLTLVVADNLLLLFVGWEVMGLCSYLLIGFWYEKESAYQAAIKAFMTTRVADVIFMIGIAYLWASTGTLNFREIMFNPTTLQTLGSTPAIGGILGLSAAGLIGVCIVIGTIGKSAQFPLHTWLPDAMEGPTPVSAMIHAATMVSAGVYLVIRMYPVLSAGGNPEQGIFTAPMTLMALVGAFTALFASSIALVQHDIKRVLAYSTISQLGYMVAALGVGAYAAAALHLIAHAFFKALLFLGSGSVIHGMEHGEHLAHAAHTAHDAPGKFEEPGHGEHAAPLDAQDMRNMGGLFQTMPVTAITFIIGGCALAGVPLFAGFWSKDAIFAETWNAGTHNILGIIVLIVLALAAILTLVYTARQIALTFFGSPRTEAARNAHHNDGTAKGRQVSATLTGPLIILAFFAVVIGYWEFFGFGHWVGQTLVAPPAEGPVLSLIAVIISLVVFVVGGYVAWIAYLRPVSQGQLDPSETDPVEAYLGPEAYNTIRHKYYVDEIYDRYLVRPARWLSDVFAPRLIDRDVIDRVLAWIANAAIFVGNMCREFNRVVIDGVGDGIPLGLVIVARRLRAVQNGHIQRYLLYALSAAVFIGLNLIAALVLSGSPWLVIVILVEVAAAAVVVFLYNDRQAASRSAHNPHGSGD